MSYEVVRFIVRGTPEPKGSTRAFVPKGWTKAVVTSDNPDLKGWASLVRHEAQRAGGAFVAVLPVRVSLHFALKRPKRLLTKTWKHRGLWHTTKPDLDKLARAVKDALTGVLWTDDAQVAQLLAEKSYADADEGPCCHVCVETLTVDR